MQTSLSISPAVTTPSWQQLLVIMNGLALMQNIPSMEEYAANWVVLAGMFEELGLAGCAAYCWERFEQYRGLEPGEYVRLIEGQLAELIMVP